MRGFEYQVLRCSGLSERNLDDLFGEILSLVRAGKAREALERLDGFLEADPSLGNIWAVWALRGEIMHGLNEFSEALKCLDRALELESEHAALWLNRGLVLGDLGKVEEALESFDKALEIAPDFAEAWLIKGTVLWVLGRKDEAMSCFKRAIQLKPSLIETLERAGIKVS